MTRKTKRQKVGERLQAVGAAWAVRSDRYVSPDDPMGAQVRRERRYHVHPDVHWPINTAILRFRTLDEINEWCKMREDQAEVMADAPPDPGPDATEAEYVAWERKTDRLHGMQERIADNYWESLL